MQQTIQGRHIRRHHYGNSDGHSFGPEFRLSIRAHQHATGERGLGREGQENIGAANFAAGGAEQPTGHPTVGRESQVKGLLVAVSLQPPTGRGHQRIQRSRDTELSQSSIRNRKPTRRIREHGHRGAPTPRGQEADIDSHSRSGDRVVAVSNLAAQSSDTGKHQRQFALTPFRAEHSLSEDFTPGFICCLGTGPNLPPAQRHLVKAHPSLRIRIKTSRRIRQPQNNGGIRRGRHPIGAPKGDLQTAHRRQRQIKDQGHGL